MAARSGASRALPMSAERAHRSFAATLLELTRLQATASQLRARYVSVMRARSPSLPSPAPHRMVELAAIGAAQVRAASRTAVQQ